MQAWATTSAATSRGPRPSDAVKAKALASPAPRVETRAKALAAKAKALAIPPPRVAAKVAAKVAT